MFLQDEASLRKLIDRYQQRIFALVLYLIGSDRDKAYDIATSSFAEAIRATLFLEKEDIFLVRVVGAAVKKSRGIKVVPSFDYSDFMDLAPEERESLRIVKIAFGKLPFNAKEPILLRDQLNLAYKDIAAILRISEKNARIQTIQGRSKLRREIEDILSHGG